MHLAGFTSSKEKHLNFIASLNTVAFELVLNLIVPCVRPRSVVGFHPSVPQRVAGREERIRTGLGLLIDWRGLCATHCDWMKGRMREREKRELDEGDSRKGARGECEDTEDEEEKRKRASE